jgi:peptidyl-prolyl cis-trans isomerase D
MLDAMRRGASSWVVKVLLGVLVLSFALWGIGDVFLGTTDPAVVEVGEVEIGRAQVDEQFRRNIARLQEQLGTAVTREEAAQLGVLEQTVQGVVADALVGQAAQDLGLTIDDATLRSRITQDPVFQDVGGFDRNRFELLLQRAGMSEAAYVDSLRREGVRANLLGSLAAPVQAPDVLVDTLYAYRNETRDGRAVIVQASALADPPTPDDATLEAFRAENEARYSVPERRALTLVMLDVDELAAETEVAEARVREVYEERKAGLTTPERRTVVQLLAPNEAVIREAAERVAAGEAIRAVGEDLAGRGVQTDELADLTRATMIDEVGAVAFEVDLGSVGGPVQSPFGWHLVEVTDVRPEQVPSFAEAAPELRAELAREDALDALPDLAAALEDELAAGGTLEEAAAALRLPISDLPAVDEAGLDATGIRPEGLPDWPEVLEVAFDVDADEPSRLEESDAGGYFVVRVDQIESARMLSLEEAREQVTGDWRASRRREVAKERATDLRQQLADGADLATLAEDPAISVLELQGLRRADTGASGGIGREAIQALFTAAPGQVAAEVVPASAGSAVILVDALHPADPAADTGQLATLRDELTRQMQADVLAQYENELRRRYPVQLNSGALSTLIEPAS